MPALEIVIIVVLTLANGFFAASEIAVVSSRRGRLQQRAEEGNRGAAVALELADNPNRFLSTVQVGITLIGTFAAAFGGASLAEELEAGLSTVPALAPYAGTISLTAVVALISYLSLILGELVPKRLALQNAEGIASAIAPIMRLVAKIASPIVSFLTFSTEVVLRVLRRHNVEETAVSEEDVIALAREGVAEGTLEAAEHEMIINVFSLTDRTVRSLMTPRTEMHAVEISTPVPAAMDALIASGHSRLPVYEERVDQIVGILFANDLLRVCKQSEGVDLRSLVRPPVYLPEGQRATVALRRFREMHCSIGIVVGEYGQVSGLITVGDIFSEIMGEMGDEHGVAGQQIVRREDGSYLVDGLLPVSDLQDHMAIPGVEELAREHHFDTVAGLLLLQFGRLPAAGDSLTWQGYRFEVLDMDGNRIDKVLVQPVERSSTEQSEGALALGAVLPRPERPEGNKKSSTEN
ncbi:MAG TPA: hemolysin family protein [Chloroflexia bacterium]|nr:hemolysin family protein [Chloroflexia bacterium]